MQTGEIIRVYGGTESGEFVAKTARGRDGRVCTYSKVVNVTFNRIASARLVAPAVPISLSLRLEGSLDHNNHHADRRRYSGIWRNNEEKRGGQKTTKSRKGRVRTYSKVDNVTFNRIASARLVAPAVPITFLRRLECCPEHTTTPMQTGEVIRVYGGTESGGVFKKTAKGPNGRWFALASISSTWS
jgi:hypothetical protein